MAGGWVGRPPEHGAQGLRPVISPGRHREKSLWPPGLLGACSSFPAASRGLRTEAFAHKTLPRPPETQALLGAPEAGGLRVQMGRGPRPPAPSPKQDWSRRKLRIPAPGWRAPTQAALGRCWGWGLSLEGGGSCPGESRGATGGTQALGRAVLPTLPGIQILALFKVPLEGRLSARQQPLGEAVGSQI